ncbi:MAG: class I SAM-dependent methyltransferase [Deltaproteobacteria bacterium]|nr:class I SAM-dependent methyltransferase [Deltaproteobacteria bacterium]
MDQTLKQSMMAYYSERAPEYDEIYTAGKGPTSINDPLTYKEETNRLKQIVNTLCAGDILDVPSGTAFWLPSYAHHCATVLLVDQSLKMLKESRERARQNGLEDRCSFLQTDIFNYDWAGHQFDTVLVGFFISHLTAEEESLFFSKVCDALKPSGKLLILDSTWSQERAKTRNKEGEQARKLNDGTEFTIYKKYFTLADIETLGKKFRLTFDVHYFGRTFCAFSGRRPPTT